MRQETGSEILERNASTFSATKIRNTASTDGWMDGWTGASIVGLS
jgi:hypothetical protein